MPKVRFYEKKAITILFVSKPVSASASIFFMQAIEVAGDWALAELTSGDKACGAQLGRWVIEQAQTLNPIWAQQVQARFVQAGYSPIGTAISSCPTDIVPWDHGLPWRGPGNPD